MAGLLLSEMLQKYLYLDIYILVLSSDFPWIYSALIFHLFHLSSTCSYNAGNCVSRRSWVDLASSPFLARESKKASCLNGRPAGYEGGTWSRIAQWSGLDVLHLAMCSYKQSWQDRWWQLEQMSTDSVSYAPAFSSVPDRPVSFTHLQQYRRTLCRTSFST